MIFLISIPALFFGGLIYMFKFSPSDGTFLIGNAILGVALIVYSIGNPILTMFLNIKAAKKRFKI
ncbi:hypothetical protein RV15_GL001261 [Enterococcus silesiacus]|uniref:Uncharacterized protein n=2 Tax=Enterococcus silesiacus TaxID=332949 RepID=A0AA91GD27_9ENTE|nr:hypothetical protein RV15_GL001261 [Enterococcus silesiacus]